MKHIIYIFLLISILSACQHGTQSGSCESITEEAPLSRHDFVEDSLSNLDKQYLLGGIYFGMDSIAYDSVANALYKTMGKDGLLIANLRFNGPSRKFYNDKLYELSFYIYDDESIYLPDFHDEITRCVAKGQTFVERFSEKYGKPTYTRSNDWSNYNYPPAGALVYAQWEFSNRTVEFKYGAKKGKNYGSNAVIHYWGELHYTTPKQLSEEEIAASKVNNDSIRASIEEAKKINDELIKNL